MAKCAWSFKEILQAFGWNIDQYIFYGGYTGATALMAVHSNLTFSAARKDHQFWGMVVESAVGATFSKEFPVKKKIMIGGEGIPIKKSMNAITREQPYQSFRSK